MNKVLVTIALVGLLAGTACSVSTEAEPPQVGGYATVYTNEVPVDIYTYPRVEYEGGYAYYVHDRWYYPTGHGWVRFREEPAPLARRRPYVQAAPPANHREDYREHEHVEPSGPHEAPPAVRVR